MLVVKAWCLPKLNEPQLNSVHKKLVEAAASISTFGVTGENDMGRVPSRTAPFPFTPACTIKIPAEALWQWRFS